MLLLAKVITWLQIAIFLVFGVWGYASPRGLAKLSEIGLPNSLAEAEFRSFYGGSAMGVTVLLLLAACTGRWREALWIQIGIYGSIVCGRLIHLALNGGLESQTWKLLATEVASLALAVVALRGTPDGR
jgi:hypothetical protein